ncbi:MAG: alpha-L-arabinofuranosidase C-terminal domain-containing protein, partial [Prevotella sp.]|nr:alpha-L-arabinofuranosidase C-terminal domain-containing protein [Prevotella sp.]
VYGRLHNLQGKAAKIRVEIVDDQDVPIDRQSISINGTQWQKYTVSLTSKKTVEKGLMRIFLESEDGVDLDHVSLFPEDNWHGLRADLVKDLEDLNPGIFRFPGGCIVEGTDLTTRYQWKNSVGPAENRPLNENRWNYTFPHRLYPNYYQTYGLGFYEFFLLSEKIGAEPLPILSVGLSCQFQNKDDAQNAHCTVDELQPYIDDALDLIEFANGATTTKWGKLRADMGHPQPFNLKQIGIGNEQWGELYPVRLQKFMEQIRAKYPNIKICGSSGPSASGDRFDYGWEQMRKLGVDLVDEHYYMAPDWFLKNANRYDNYDRRGPKVFAGEYASHVKDLGKEPTVAMNNFEAALSEAAFMTGLERNADVVHQATYAPLFAHVDGWQWRPDLIWFNNLKSVRSVNWYVQMLYGTNTGTNVLSLTEDGKPLTGQDELYASAVYDKVTKQYIVKIVNTGDNAQQISLNFKGAKKLGEGIVTTFHADDMKATNSLDNPKNVVPQQSSMQANGDNATVTVPAKTFAVYKF